MVYGSALHGRRAKREPAAIENDIQNFRNRLYYDKIFFFVKHLPKHRIHHIYADCRPLLPLQLTQTGETFVGSQEVFL